MFSFGGKQVNKKKRKELYLDYAASTPVDEDIIDLMKPYWDKYFYNPGALYGPAVCVKKDLELSRSRIAEFLRVTKDEIFFTSGATEANQLAIVGAIAAAREAGVKSPEVMIASTEHPSIRNLCLGLADRKEITLVQIPVDEKGIVDLKFIRKELSQNTALVSINYVNNETGTRQPLLEVAKIIRHYRKHNNTNLPLFHSDAVQAAVCSDLSAIIFAVDTMTLSSQKIYGPKGVGFLYKSRRAKLLPVFRGGDQEKGYRSGTENVAAIVGGTEALIRALDSWSENSIELSTLREYCLKGIVEITKAKAIIHQGLAGSQSPHILNFTIPGINGELLVIELSERGVYAAARAACSTNDKDASHVLAAMYKDHQKKFIILNTGSVRISFGKMTTLADINFFLEQMKTIIAKYL